MKETINRVISLAREYDSSLDPAVLEGMRTALLAGSALADTKAAAHRAAGNALFDFTKAANLTLGPDLRVAFVNAVEAYYRGDDTNGAVGPWTDLCKAMNMSQQFISRDSRERDAFFTAVEDNKPTADIKPIVHQFLVDPTCPPGVVQIRMHRDTLSAIIGAIK